MLCPHSHKVYVGPLSLRTIPLYLFHHANTARTRQSRSRDACPNAANTTTRQLPSFPSSSIIDRSIVATSTAFAFQAVIWPIFPGVAPSPRHQPRLTSPTRSTSGTRPHTHTHTLSHDLARRVTSYVTVQSPAPAPDLVTHAPLPDNTLTTSSSSPSHLPLVLPCRSCTEVKHPFRTPLFFSHGPRWRTSCQCVHRHGGRAGRPAGIGPGTAVQPSLPYASVLSPPLPLSPLTPAASHARSRA
jgi:hypothetical protein